LATTAGSLCAALAADGGGEGKSDGAGSGSSNVVSGGGAASSPAVRWVETWDYRGGGQHTLTAEELRAADEQLAEPFETAAYF
jgi:hypothetical protein